MTRRTKTTVELAEAYDDLTRRAGRRSDRAGEADDIAQDAVVRALGVSIPRKIRQPGRYLLRIARNLFIDRTRRRAREAVLFEEPRSGDREAADPFDPERLLRAKQELRIAMDAIEALPPRCREAFRLHRFEEMSYAAISRQMGISVSMVEKHMSEAMRKIAAALGEGGKS